MGFVEKFMLSFFKFKVVHSIPGRLRVSVPALKNTPQSFQIDPQKITSLIKEVKGIKEADYNYISGNALISYDMDIINEKEILDLAKKILQILLNNKNQLEEMFQIDEDKAIEIAKDLVKKEIEI